MEKQFMYLYSVKDTVADDFGPVFQAKNDGVAFRQLRNMFKTSGVINPNEYELWCVCKIFDDMSIEVEKRQLFIPKMVEVTND